MTEDRLDLEVQLREWADDLAGSIPTSEARDASHLVGLAPARRDRRSLVLVAALASLLLAAGTVWRVGDDTRGHVVAGPPDTASRQDHGTITAHYERIEYVQEAQLTCRGPSLSQPNRFNSMTIEAWSVPARADWRNTVTYPDGSSRDLIVTGRPTTARQAFGRGRLRGDKLGCDVDGNGILGHEPAQGSLYSLNPFDEGERTPTGQAITPGYADLGTQLPGEHLDSRGRSALLWRNEVTGFADFDGGRHALVQTTDWFVEPDTGKVLEQTYVNQVEALGKARFTATLIESGSVSVDADFFDRTQYDAWK